MEDGVFITLNDFLEMIKEQGIYFDESELGLALLNEQEQKALEQLKSSIKYTCTGGKHD